MKFKPYIWRGSPEPSSALCPRCQSIDLEAIFQLDVNKIGKGGVPVFDLGNSPLAREETCQMCKWLHCHDIHSPGIKKSWRLRVYPYWSLFAMQPSSHNRNMSLVLGLCTGEPERRRRGLHSNGDIENLLLPSYEDAQKLKGGRLQACGCRLARSQVDGNTISSFLEACEQEHKEGAKPIPVLPSILRVIDCQTRRIIPFVPGMRYVALSYVWGGIKTTAAEDESIRNTQCLPAHDSVPETVADAMYLANETGLRYLWVDRYCIHQFHCPEDKAIQIPAMGDIFEAAVFTIIALGINAASGLDGVSRPFLPQFRVECRGRTYISSGHSLQYFLERSQWATRAWIYQEAVLSRRCLILTPEQAFFLCHQGTFSETIPTPASEQLTRSFMWSNRLLNPKTFIPMGATSDPEHLRRLLDVHLREYRTRCLTENSDGLNAFKGILSRMDAYTLYGVPIHAEAPDQLGKFLAFGLCWGFTEANRAAVRSEALLHHFPSWSWASTSGGKLEFQDPSGYNLSGQTYHAKISAQLEPSIRVPLEDLIQPNGSRFLAEKTKILSITSYTFNEELPVKENAPKDLHNEYISKDKSLYSFRLNWDSENLEEGLHSSSHGSLKAILMIQYSWARNLVYEDDLIVSATEPGLWMCWLLVQCRQGHPARRVGVMHVAVSAMDSSTLTKETIELE